MDKGAFDAKYWNFTQVMAWVLLGDRGLVCSAADGVNTFGTFIAEHLVPDGTGHWGEKRAVELNAGRPNATTLESWNAEYGRPIFTSYSDAERDVIAALQDGKLEAHGLANGSGDLVPIESIRWADLCIFWDREVGPYASPSEIACPGATVWKADKCSVSKCP